MESFELLPKRFYSSLCQQLKDDSSRALKIISILMMATPDTTEECYVQLTPDGKVDPTVIVVKITEIISVLKEIYGKSILIYCQDPDILPKFLSKNNVIDWSDLHSIRDASEEELPYFQKASEEHDGKYIEVPLNTFYLQDTTHLKAEIPDDVQLVRLTPQMVEMVRSHWRYGQFSCNEFLAPTLLGEKGRSIGLVKKTSPNELMSWVGLNHCGRIGFLHTLEEHRGKGYARIVVTHLAKEMLEEDRVPTCHVIPENKTSENIFVQLGFQLEGGRPNFWLLFIPRTAEAEQKHNRGLKELEKIDMSI